MLTFKLQNSMLFLGKTLSIFFCRKYSKLSNFFENWDAILKIFGDNMLIIENELKRLDEDKEQLKLIKECLWHKQIVKGNWRL